MIFHVHVVYIWWNIVCTLPVISTFRGSRVGRCPKIVGQSTHGSLVENQSSTLTDMQRLVVGACIFRMAFYSVDNNVSRASSVYWIRRNSRNDTPVFEEMRDFGASATHFAQFPWPRLWWGVRSPFGTAVGRAKMSAAGKRLDISWIARASWRLRRYNFQGCIYLRHIRHLTILQFHRDAMQLFLKISHLNFLV